MDITTKASDLLKQAEAIAQSVETWADLSNALFDPFVGIVSRAFPARCEREAFAQTAEYRKIRDLSDDARDRFGLVAGATPKQSRPMVLNVPLALQGALEREAKAEGVSLDELVVTKLKAPLAALTPK